MIKFFKKLFRRNNSNTKKTAKSLSYEPRKVQTGCMVELWYPYKYNSEELEILNSLVKKLLDNGFKYAEIKEILDIISRNNLSEFEIRAKLLDSIEQRNEQRNVGRSSSPISDQRWKKNIKSLNGALDNILALRGVSFEWRNDEFPDMNFNNQTQIGLIAQEVEKVLPEIVEINNDGFKSIQYLNLIPLLIEAIKEQQRQIENLKKIKNE